jgi:hypothetical protein
LLRILHHFFGNPEDRDHKQLTGEQIRTNSLRICSVCVAGEHVSQVVIENPIINSPFDEPNRHFRFDDEGGITA